MGVLAQTLCSAEGAETDFQLEIYKWEESPPGLGDLALSVPVSSNQSYM